MTTNASSTHPIRYGVGKSRLSMPSWVLYKTLPILYEHLLSALTVLRDALPIYCLSYFRWDVSLPNFYASFSYKHRPRHFLLIFETVFEDSWPVIPIIPDHPLHLVGRLVCSTYP